MIAVMWAFVALMVGIIVLAFGAHFFREGLVVLNLAGVWLKPGFGGTTNPFKQFQGRGWMMA
jgi:hypothetical protein